MAPNTTFPAFALLAVPFAVPFGADDFACASAANTATFKIAMPVSRSLRKPALQCLAYMPSHEPRPVAWVLVPTNQGTGQ